MTTKPSALLRGFTLIEMIFIIVIVGIMMSLLVSSYQQRATNVKLTKAALQMQSLLQAASAYYKTYNCWPDANSTGQICKIEPVPPPTDFTPVGIDKDPWGGDYTQATATDSSQAFTVSATKVPKNLAARLAALIGATSTVCDNNLCTVTARVNSPFSVKLNLAT
ncbi:MAG: type II secretion system protein [Coxiellaceae bacterium]|nr:MAG: type II secretion system protein [Coxiellaceae bacterium]